MQSVCAHCYAPLTHKRQHTACILCARCEEDWAHGRRRQRGAQAWRTLQNWKPAFTVMTADRA